MLTVDHTELNALDKRDTGSRFITCYRNYFGCNYSGERKCFAPNECFEILINLGDPCKLVYQKNEIEVTSQSGWFLGQLLSPFSLEFSEKVDLISVKLFPWVMPALTNFRCNRLRNKMVPLDRIFRLEADSLMEDLIQFPLTKDNRQEILEEFFQKRDRGPQNLNYLLVLAFDYIYRDHGFVQVTDIAKKLRINRRTLQYYFQDTLGISPTECTRKVRLGHILGKSKELKDYNLTWLAYESGYADQSHFIRDFRKMVQVTPSDFFKDYHPEVGGCQGF